MKYKTASAICALMCLSWLALASVGHAQSDCGTVLDCRATAAAANAQAAQYVQATRDSIRATAETIATERAEIAQATAQARAAQATQTAVALPTATALPTNTPQPIATATPGPTATPSVTPLPTATERPSALDRVVDRILTQPTPRPEGSAEPKTPWTTYLVWVLLALFALGMLKVIFGQVTTTLPPESLQAWRNDDEHNID